jgi:hypothetical protein
MSHAGLSGCANTTEISLAPIPAREGELSRVRLAGNSPDQLLHLAGVNHRAEGTFDIETMVPQLQTAKRFTAI